MVNRKMDLDILVKSLDITPTMYRNAVERYTSISTYLKSQGLEADFYPQGSFRLGTVVRPLKDGKDADYDLDVICQLQDLKECTTPLVVKTSVGEALLSNKMYADRLLPEDDRCWTLQYDLINDVGFTLDVVPSVKQSDQTFQDFENGCILSEFIDDMIAITERVSKNNYIWQSSNPKGYALWFDTINYRFLAYNREARKQAILNENRALYESVEEIPKGIERSALQRVIQILKRHRDLYYYRSRKTDKKPISAIITTLSTKIASHAQENLSTFELLEFISNDLEKYSSLLQGKSAGLYENCEVRAYIKKNEQKWRIINPVDQNDNYADSWDDETANLFFKWVSAVKQDFIDVAEQTEERYYAGLKNGIGTKIVENSITASLTKKTSAVIVSGTKPWRCSSNKQRN